MLTPQVKKGCFLLLYDIIIVSLTTVQDLSQSYHGISILMHSLLCLQEKKKAQGFLQSGDSSRLLLPNTTTDLTNDYSKPI